MIYASYVGIGVPEVVERIELADDALVTGLKLATGLLVVISDDDGARVVVVLVVAMVLENRVLRQKLDNSENTVAYEPEVLRLWVSRSFDDYRDASELRSNTNHLVWKVRTPDGTEAVLKRYVLLRGWGG